MLSACLRDTPAEALASEAYIRGRRDRLNGFCSIPTPYPPGSAEEREYQLGQQSADAQISAAAEAGIRRDQAARLDGRPDHDRDTRGAFLRTGT